MTWEKGRQLKKFDGVSYTYNANGIRTSKNVYGTKHDYVLDGAKIVRGTWKIGDVVNFIVPLYDNEDSVCGIIYNEVPYYFLKNQQGDIIAITDNTGTELARYSYDAWGVCTVTYTDMERTCGIDIANINPFRYRSYYFDKEIGMYYLQSRYYDPTVGRFVNGDENIFSGILGTNIYGYCHNNITNGIDSDGERTYFINGINNSSSSGVPKYATDFKKELMKLGVKDVRTIGIYKCKSKSYIVNTLNGVGKVF